jgi:hypothetical protein
VAGATQTHSSSHRLPSPPCRRLTGRRGGSFPQARAATSRSDLSEGICDDKHLDSGGIGHIGTRLTLQADVEARQNAREHAGWARMALANARNLELAAREREGGH